MFVPFFEWAPLCENSIQKFDSSCPALNFCYKNARKMISNVYTFEILGHVSLFPSLDTV